MRWVTATVRRMTLGRLTTRPALRARHLLADPVAAMLADLAVEAPVDAELVLVADIDPEHADTAAFTAAYGVPPSASANCVVVAGRRDGIERVAACVVLATTRADVNGVVRRLLDVRKASFLSVDRAVELSAMEYGGITPLGLPPTWQVLVDAAVADSPEVVVGSGLRRSKIVLPGALLARLPSTRVVVGLGVGAEGLNCDESPVRRNEVHTVPKVTDVQVSHHHLGGTP